MVLLIVQNIDNLGYEYYKNYNNISDDSENSNLCIARERLFEINECLKNNIPVVYHNGIDNKCLQIFNDYHNNIYYICRGTIGFKNKLKKCLPSHYIPIISFEDDYKVIHWYRFNFHNRKIIEIYSNAWSDKQIEKQLIKIFKDKFFIKTINKHVSSICHINNNQIDYTDWNAILILDSPYFIASEYIDIAQDKLGKIELRCFVINNKLHSVSRYQDYKSFNANKYLENINEIIEKITKSNDFPKHYVMDICITNNDNVEIVEFNNIESSGRYKDNSPTWCVDLLKLYME